MDLRARVLCVDDDDAVLRVFAKILRIDYDVIVASNGAQALERLGEYPDTAVILSDMWMGEMDGITLLSRAHEQAPDAIGILLTGQPELNTAIEAVNQGHIFRFIPKPVPMLDLQAAVAAAVRQHQLVSAERVLLEQTLHGSIRALTDALSLTNPLAFGRAIRARDVIAALTDAMLLPHSWQLEIAAMLSQLATITLPHDTLERLCYQREMSADEKAMVARLPAINDQLLGHIPRLEVVREILRTVYDAPLITTRTLAEADLAQLGAQMLRIALDYDLLQLQGKDPATTIDILRGRRGMYQPAMLDALATMLGTQESARDVRELPLADLRGGMVLLDDLVLTTGMLLVCGGATVTVGLLERLRNLPARSVREPVRVNVSAAPELSPG